MVHRHCEAGFCTAVNTMLQGVVKQVSIKQYVLASHNIPTCKDICETFADCVRKPHTLFACFVQSQCCAESSQHAPPAYRSQNISARFGRRARSLGALARGGTPEKARVEPALGTPPEVRRVERGHRPLGIVLVPEIPGVDLPADDAELVRYASRMHALADVNFDGKLSEPEFGNVLYKQILLEEILLLISRYYRCHWNYQF